MTSLKTGELSPADPRTPNLRTAAAAVALARPRQWVKNVAVLLPFLDPQVWDRATLAGPALAVAAFMLASSLVYAVNDIADRFRDRHHPVKRFRPLASGAVSVRGAVLVAVACGAGSAALAAAADPLLLVPITAYIGLNLAYSRGLREVPVLELFAVAAGFPLRALAGYVVLDTAPANLVVLSVLFLSLLLVLGKRRREIVVAGAAHRAALKGYTAPLLEQFTSIAGGLATATFLLFALGGPQAAESKGPLAMLVVPLLLMALFRYLQRLELRGGDGDPTRLLVRDPVLLAIGAACLACIAATTLLDLSVLYPND
ncbi:UbiA prenyltransferase family protein [Glycomyces albidus]|uniref:Prenyltransferase n=1 Tax=Glycomyces albidus TaxID=2656774 RepID=A0A6L5G7B2_9ACTN|nr:UbiA prenyltransferase family protein [Glycomyces albidus]MQM25503.1 prenyltransferase [Glycomyces albidus]